MQYVWQFYGARGVDISPKSSFFTLQIKEKGMIVLGKPWMNIVRVCVGVV